MCSRSHPTPRPPPPSALGAWLGGGAKSKSSGRPMFGAPVHSVRPVRSSPSLRRTSRSPPPHYTAARTVLLFKDRDPLFLPKTHFSTYTADKEREYHDAVFSVAEGPAREIKSFEVCTLERDRSSRGQESVCR